MNFKKTFVLTVLLCFGMLCGAEKRGIVCFTFDDYSGPNWLKADKIFKRYNVRVTFFVVGRITPEKIAVMKKLQDAGHSIGLHTISHRNAVPMPAKWNEKIYFEREVKPQLDICRKNGIIIKGLAYPNNRRNDAIDRELFKHFDYLRAGIGKQKKIFYTRDEIKNKMVIGGKGIGKYYKSDVNELKKLLSRAAENDNMIIFFSHDIKPGAAGVHMPTEMLEALLEHASKLNMHIAGINDIETVRKK